MGWTGERVKALRLARKESQADFAAAVGVDRVTVSRWETGTVPIGDLSAAALSRLENAPDTDASTDYARGIKYAAEAMAFTLGELLRTARLLETGQPPERGSDAQAIAAADAAIPSAPAGAPRGARQRRHGTG